MSYICKTLRSWQGAGVSDPPPPPPPPPPQTILPPYSKPNERKAEHAQHSFIKVCVCKTTFLNTKSTEEPEHRPQYSQEVTDSQSIFCRERFYYALNDVNGNRMPEGHKSCRIHVESIHGWVRVLPGTIWLHSVRSRLKCPLSGFKLLFNFELLLPPSSALHLYLPSV